MDFDELENDQELKDLVQDCINDPSTDLTNEDFAERDVSSVGQKIARAKEDSKAAQRLFDTLVANLIEKTRRVINGKLKEIKVQYEEYEEEEKDKALKREKSLAKRIHSAISVL